MLKDNTQNYHNIIIEHAAIGPNNKIRDFYFVKGDSIHKLGKHWASGIGSFNKEHILNHRSKRFEIKEIYSAKPHNTIPRLKEKLDARKRKLEVGKTRRRLSVSLSKGDLEKINARKIFP